jgi:DNA-binding CsgD family transcriptional regulator
MVLVDGRRRLVTGNAGACELLKLSLAELPWCTMDDFASPAELPRLREQWASLVASGAVEGWYDLQIPDGESVCVECSVTATVLPDRHLLVFIPLENGSTIETEAPLARATTWSPVGDGEAPQPLTEREREIMTLVAGGLRSGDIAEHLFLAPETVKSHVANAMSKLGSHTRAGAVTIALVTGQISWEI